MSAATRLALVTISVLIATATGTNAYAAPAASLEQVRNGPADAPTTPTPMWVSGNAGASNAHYLESHSIAYRTLLTELPTDGTVIELVLGYDVKSSGNYALDYLTHYQRILPHVLFGHTEPEVFDPLAGVAGVSPLVTTSLIPVPTNSVLIDPDGPESEPAAPQPTASADSLPDNERLMTLFGGTLIDVTYLVEADVSLNTKSSESQVLVRFTADSPTAVLAWGGHIASRWEWGFEPDGMPRSAGGIKGSSYHMRLVDWNLGNLGNQDRSMSTDAVYPVPRCGISNPGPFCAGTMNTHTAPSGMESYTWEIFNNTAGAFFVGGNMGTSVTVQTTNAGSYGLMLTTTASGFFKQCSAEFTVNAPATAVAGSDIVVCADAPQAQLSGSVSGGAPSWSGGSGTFDPSANELNAIYTPSAAEIAAGSVLLTLTSTPVDAACPPVSDQFLITIDALPIVDAGPDQVVCESSALVQLAGSVGGSVTGGIWSGGEGTFNPSPTDLNATYLPSAGEIAAGTVELTLTSEDPLGPCAPVNDVIVITISPVATADAGPDQLVCANEPGVQLSGSYGGAASGAEWSGGEGRFRPNRRALDARYEPSVGEIDAGTVTLILIASADSGPCLSVEDEVTITIDPLTIVDAGADITVCSSSPTAQLNGSVTGVVSGGIWSGGEGTYSPSSSDLNATYTPTAEEIDAGRVILTLTSEASSRPCPPDDDQMTVFITPEATVDAGPDQATCAESPTVQLAGSVGSGATSGSWSGGNGTFSPNANSLTATYTPTPQEIADGGVTLVLTTNDPAGPCPAVSDEIELTYSNPEANVRTRILCKEVLTTTLCANPRGGVGPYTYLWKNGETGRCREVPGPGTYWVTVTDALGCEATGSGSFWHRDCEGLISHTSVNCETFLDGTGDGLSSDEMSVQIQDNIITNIAPGVFFYWTYFVAPSESFTVDMVQAKSDPTFPFIPILHDQIVLYDVDCNRIGDGYETSPGQASVDVEGATPGDLYVVSVKYSLKGLIGTYLDPAHGVLFNFWTEIDGEVVDRDPEGLLIGSAPLVAVGDDPDPREFPSFVGPIPNPFRDGTRMVFTVPKEQESVSIKVYDVAGRLVRTLANRSMPVGRHMVSWDGRDDAGVKLRKGTYFVHVRIGAEDRKVRTTFLR